MAVKFQTNAKKEISKVMLTDVQFAYAKIGKNKEVIFDQKDLPRNQQTKFQNVVTLIVDEDTADQITEEFPKVKTTKFNSKEKLLSKITVDDPNQIKDLDKYYTFKVGQNMQDRDGNDKDLNMLPKAYLKANGKAEEITWSKSIGNGSTGDVMCNVSRNSFGQFLHLQALAVTDLVSYEAGDSLSDLLGDLEVVSEEAPTANETVEEAFDDEPPFEADSDDEFDEFE